MTGVTGEKEEKKEKNKKFLQTDGTDQSKVLQEVLADVKGEGVKNEKCALDN